MLRPRQGPTPVGQRNRAQTIPAKKSHGPSVDEDWGEDSDMDVEEYRRRIRTRDWESQEDS